MDAKHKYSSSPPLLPHYVYTHSSILSKFCAVPLVFTLISYYLLYLSYSLSFIMASQSIPHMHQDFYSYHPRHANMDFNTRQLSIPAALPQRPKNFNTYGKETTITLNTFNVLKAPNTVVHQYDVAYSGDAKDYTKRVLLKKIWYSKAIKDGLGEPANLWVWDGNKLAW
jgi:hypothetical protein